MRPPASSTRPAALPQPGEIVAGKYVIVRTVGEGGMGVVFEALHQRLGQRVAIKMLHVAARTNAEVLARFEREARAAVRLKSPNVARVIDVDSSPIDKTPFIVMELLEGHDLASEMDERIVPMGEAIGYILQACAAMSEAHALGIIHRDLKPGNLFLAQDGDRRIVKVLDFGISKLSRDPDPSVTTTQSTLGTPTYMSPEQIRCARDVDGRTDIWSLGVMLYELLAGRPPFEGGSASAVVAAISADEPTPLSEYRPDLPAPLVAAVMKAIQKSRSSRFQTIDELAEAIEPYQRAPRISIGSLPGTGPQAGRASLPSEKELSVTLPVATPVQLGASTPGTAGEPTADPQQALLQPETPAPWSRGVPQRSGSSAWRWLALTAAALGIGAGAWTFWPREPPPSEPAATVAAAPQEPSPVATTTPTAEASPAPAPSSQPTAAAASADRAAPRGATKPAHPARATPAPRGAPPPVPPSTSPPPTPSPPPTAQPAPAVPLHL